ncbi:PDZ domain-containing protein [Rhodopirellula sp. JC740]|uniref:PDZ domain-containing protein n=1 Tax=Rhodopirellula halodulae TaxID=2894198 RepID=A0ABS8NNC2_9BACT|nr:PDZ domain-containing protein [Rhodopirellula sp. JC740]MCC9645089.1 PDZ domain-containing protein [Rhodopirellula sp. JC740]
MGSFSWFWAVSLALLLLPATTYLPPKNVDAPSNGPPTQNGPVKDGATNDGAQVADGDPEKNIDAAPLFVEPRPGERHPPGIWYLGVFGKYGDRGLLLTEVHASTPAARAGLEPGDRLLTVNGHQVGDRPGGRLNLDDALQRYSGRSGWVRLLVQDHRTQRLINVDVRLTRTRIHT